MENMIDILNKENSEYDILLELSLKKTPVIIQGNLEELAKITDEEQIVVSRITRLEQNREDVFRDIANVINRDVKELKLKDLILMLKTRPEEQKLLAKSYDKLTEKIHNLSRINGQNRELIKNALEMVQFDMNLFQSMKSAPETANYNKGAFNTGSVMGPTAGSFDAKQ
jgi:flagellar biosynthesis/type III secretory pathway chaperone